MDRPTEKNKNKNTHERFTNPHEPGRSDIIYDFIDSGPITNATVLFTQSHAQEEVSEGNVQRTKENFCEETARSTLEPDGEVPWTTRHFESR